MKIVTINHYGVTPDMPGPSKNYEMAKYFSDKYDCKSEFWICGFSHYIGKLDESLGKLKIQSKKTIDKFSIVKIRSTPYRKNAFLRQLNITVFDIVTAIKILFSKDIDCIIMTAPPVTILNILATKIKKIKLIADVEDLWPLFLEDMGMKNKLAINYMNFGSEYMYNSADAIAAVSSGMLEYVSSKVRSNSKTMWISPLGVNVNEYINRKKNYELVDNKMWKNDYKIMYLGVHGRANDLITVLKTINTLNEKLTQIKIDKKISFIFVGEGDQKSKCMEYANSLKLNNVYFEDAVPNSLVPEYLAHADICLTNLMKIESFKLVRPNKLFQYMALGKPIISGIWGEFSEIIEEVQSGIYVDFTDEHQASNQIIEMLNDKSKLDEMSLNGVKYILEHGDRKKIFDTFYKNIRNICEEK
ncbi:glycosyltransferase family 4 protein [Paraclostridium bifermentans]|uniref:glycosyltransferase family 4 protein n=1 Tax=Paraclostridium bifermentans TaxID=1490 RepID=UPI00387B55B3